MQVPAINHQIVGQPKALAGLNQNTPAGIPGYTRSTFSGVLLTYDGAIVFDNAKSSSNLSVRTR